MAANNPKVQVTEESPGVYVMRAEESKYLVEYHKDACIGAGTCAEIATKTFEMVTNESGELKARFPNNLEDIDEDDIILAAAQSCPVFAIVIKDAKTGAQIFPPVVE